MSEDTNENAVQTTHEGAESVADGLSAPPEGEGPGNDFESPKGNKEERFRKERNEAREALAAAEERIQRMQRAEVERLASDGLSHPADLFSLSGNELADYLTEDGDVDPEKVAADVAAILAERPGLRKQTPGYDPSQGRGGRPPAKREPKSLGDVIRF
ncbi:hypothetical protein MSP7336_01477 [Mycobacterium shimoidei]|uniref:Scaffolding protein n=1 Tax=Mycobacterium shimoidei TaxID=29313 RepID=A0A375YWE5_MYCSH|nr:hypothetical protein [Mycobacterium shimoidei]SRX93241.1 hypothetical protein MSP7336_01477 [Mycobacterium shimoidei]